MGSCTISLDVGGTFTDFVLRDEHGLLHTYKSSTTPGNIVDGIFNGLSLIASRNNETLPALLGRTADFACGTTVATNAILERKVAKTALLITDGFRDTLLVREGGKPDTYNIYVDYPEPFIPRYLTFGIRERINAEGGVETAMVEEDVRAAIAQMKAWGVEAVAVSLLWSIANPVHELRVAALLDELWPEVPYSLGHKVHPTIREYRRTSATAIDASLKPVVHRNLRELESRLRDNGFAGVLSLVTSSGGRASIEEVLSKPVYLSLSGPSAMPQAVIDVSRREAVPQGNLIGVDMGGTSFDVSIVTDWKTPTHREGVIGGQLFGVPSVEVLTIGAGGGSIAHIDAGGFIHVGPESAGAMPGPACYGRGGTRPTVTDANLVRGLMDPDGFADGQMSLSRPAAEAAIREHVATPLNVTVEEAASLICLTVEQSMIAAIEDITVRRGIDPRDFVLVSGGSAGGVHAAAIARELGMRQVIVPRSAGVLSAYGINVGDVTFGFARSFFTSSTQFDAEGVNRVVADLQQEGSAFLDRMSVPAARRELVLSAEARYAGQVWQLTLPLTRGEFRDDADVAELVEGFHRLHERQYAVRAPNDPVEITELNLLAIGRAETALAAPRRTGGSSGVTRRRSAYLAEAGGAVDIAVHDLEDLEPGQTVAGPALIQDRLTVTLVPVRGTARLTEQLSIVIDLAPPAPPAKGRKAKQKEGAN